MPNWCVGDLKIRGEYGKIKEFITQEFFIEEVSAFKVKCNNVVINDDRGIKIDVGECGMWLKRTRAVIKKDIDVWLSFKNKENREKEIVTVNLGELKSAWGIDVELLTTLSFKYQIDIKIYAYECGMEFNVDFEVHKGEIIKCKEIKFEDYQWECTNSNLGG